MEHPISAVEEILEQVYVDEQKVAVHNYLGDDNIGVLNNSLNLFHSDYDEKSDQNPA